MALIKCPECGKEVSDKASSCPNCGCPITQATNTSASTSSTNLNLSPPTLKIIFIAASIIILFMPFLPFWKMVFEELNEEIPVTGFSMLRTVVETEDKTYQAFVALLLLSVLINIANGVLTALSLRKTRNIEKISAILSCIVVLISIVVLVYLIKSVNDSLTAEVGIGTYLYLIANIAVFIACLCEIKNKKA